MTLVVTGGAGFIGCNLLAYLVHQPEIERVINLDCLTYAGHLENLCSVQQSPKYAFENADLRDRVEIRELFVRYRPTHVMHLAAESHVDRSITAPADFVMTNILGTFNLLETCREFWIEDSRGPDSHRFHHVSTDEVYGSLGPTGRFTEQSPYAPNSPYAASKAASDLLVRSYNRTYGLNTVITNCSNNFGPYQFPEKLIPVIIQKVIARQPVPIYGDGKNVRDWLFVQDHVAALWQTFRAGDSGETYNIGACNEWTNRAVAELICDLVDELRPDLGGSSRELITFVQDRPGHDFRYAIDPAKISRELGWRPAFNFEGALRETVKWYLDHQDWVKTVTSKASRWKN